MELLDIYLKEKNHKWPQVMAQTAEKFVAINALQGSGFRQYLGRDISDELEERCKLYMQYCRDRDVIAFRHFYEREEKDLRASVSSSFGIEVPGRDACEIIREKYEALLSLHTQEKPMRTMGFHT